MNSITIVGPRSCMGCGACSVSCPKDCVGMECDAEGFLKPRVDEARCVKCGKCLRVCPAISDCTLHECKTTLLFRSLIDQTSISSSGGAGYSLALQIVKMGGVVIACAFDENGNARHVVVDSADHLKRIQGSKYVQSDVRNGYRACLDLLRQGKMVLFIGTPCQVAAVEKLCGEFDTLITCDLICHGTPSPMFWQKDLEYQNGRGRLIPKNAVQFRNHGHFGRVVYELHCGRNRFKAIPFEFDPYYSLFMSNASLRESCYTCRFANKRRAGDITIGDAASMDFYPSFHGDMPVSTVCANTDTGEMLLNAVIDGSECDSVELDYEREAGLNKQLHEPASRPSIRDSVYVDLMRLDYGTFAKKYMATPPIGWWIKRVVKGIIPTKLLTSIKAMKSCDRHG